jgi:hypothetical protein
MRMIVVHLFRSTTSSITALQHYDIVAEIRQPGDPFVYKTRYLQHGLAHVCIPVRPTRPDDRV